MLKEKMENEPVMVAEIIKAVLVMAISFGLTVTPEQLAAIMTVVGLVSAFAYTRKRVSPMTGEANGENA